MGINTVGIVNIAKLPALEESTYLVRKSESTFENSRNIKINSMTINIMHHQDNVPQGF
jgi:hypothetical protein